MCNIFLGIFSKNCRFFRKKAEFSGHETAKKVIVSITYRASCRWTLSAGCRWRRFSGARRSVVTIRLAFFVDAVRERRLAKFRQSVARFRLYRLRFLQENMRFAAFFKIYQVLKLKFLKFDKNLQILRYLQFFNWNFTKIAVFSNRFFAKFLRLQRCKRMQIL